MSDKLCVCGLSNATVGSVVLHADHLAAMAAAEARSEEMAELLREALHEMCNTVAPRNSFTDVVNRIDAALSEQLATPSPQ